MPRLPPILTRHIPAYIAHPLWSGLLVLIFTGPAATALAQAAPDSTYPDPEPFPESTPQETEPTGGGEGPGMPDAPVDEEPPGPVFTMADASQDKLSGRLESMAQRMDHYFGDERAFEDATDTYIQADFATLWVESESLQFDPKVKSRLDLPGTKKRFQLLIETDPYAEEDTGAAENPLDAVEQQDYYLSLEREARGTGKWRIRPSVGVKATWPPDLFARLRIQRYDNLGDWLARPSVVVSWFDSKGVEVRGTLDLDHALGERLMFRSSSGLRWRERDDLTSAAQTFSLFHTLDDRRGLVYETGAVADDDPRWFVDDYFVRVRFRVRLHKQWLFGEVRPQVDFYEEDNYAHTWSLMLRLEVLFGERYRAGKTPDAPRDAASP